MGGEISITQLVFRRGSIEGMFIAFFTFWMHVGVETKAQCSVRMYAVSSADIRLSTPTDKVK